MCGVYWIDFDSYAKQLDTIRIVHPGQIAPVIAARGRSLIASEKKWGYANPGKSGLIINARAETITEKKLFQSGIRSHRIAIPARGFFEWNRNKEKVSFTRNGKDTMYMAGIYDVFDNEECFTIVTTAANDSMMPTHDRMPLILEKNQVKDWILDDRRTWELLKQVPVQLEAYQEVQQMSLFGGSEWY